MEKTNYALVRSNATKQKKTVLGYIKSLVKDTYDEILVSRAESRFAEDVEDQIKKKQRRIEDIQDEKLDYLKTSSIKTDSERKDVMVQVISFDDRITALEGEIDKLKQFSAQYLSK